MRLLLSIFCLVTLISPQVMKAQTHLAIERLKYDPNDGAADFTLKWQSHDLDWIPANGKSKASLVLLIASLDKTGKVIGGRKESITITADSVDARQLGLLSTFFSTIVKISPDMGSVRFLIQSPEGKELSALEVDVERIYSTLQIPVVRGGPDVALNRPTSAAGRLAGRPVNGEQLQQMLTAANHQPDKKLAKQLYELELTERLSTAKLTRCEASLPGPEARRALRLLVDQSLFSDSLASEIAAIAEPNLEAQSKMVALSVDYANKTIRQLPNLYATKVTNSFERKEKKPLHWVRTESAIVRYRDGEEILGSGDSQLLGAQGMTTSGEFGPVLTAALLDAGQGDLSWSHWEQGVAGPEAVFRYAVAAGKSHYHVNGQSPAYRGEITLDPSNGTILRLMLRADPNSSDALLRADFVIEYGPVELGGKTYICPLKGVAVSVEPRLWSLNDITFEQYHLYRATAHILTGP
ncbi:MAG: hypothetical protein WA510_28570 [Acidobacteriaceae bacterium]